VVEAVRVYLKHDPFFSPLLAPQPHTSHLTPHTSQLTAHSSHLTPHTSHLSPLTSHLSPHTRNIALPPFTPCSNLTPHTSHLTMQLLKRGARTDLKNRFGTTSRVKSPPVPQRVTLMQVRRRMKQRSSGFMRLFLFWGSLHRLKSFHMQIQSPSSQKFDCRRQRQKRERAQSRRVPAGAGSVVIHSCT
jgi:hypothetical protein